MNSKPQPAVTLQLAALRGLLVGRALADLRCPSVSRALAAVRRHVLSRALSALRRPVLGRTLPALLVGAALSLPAAAQPRIGQGSLLVATDEIGDPSWSQTVVLVLHHDSNGTLGVAVNRPTEVSPQELVPDLGDVPGFEGQIFRGGPVRPTQLVFLVRNPPAGMLSNAPRILEGIYASSDLAVLPQIIEAGGGNTLRLYAGHVEWAPGQLDREIADDRWTVTAGSPDRVFSPEPSLLWQRLRNSTEELLVDLSELEVERAKARALFALSRMPHAGRAASAGPR